MYLIAIPGMYQHVREVPQQWHAMSKVQLSSLQNPSIIPLYWLVYRDSPFLDSSPNILASTIPERVINQQGFWTLLQCYPKWGTNRNPPMLGSYHMMVTGIPYCCPRLDRMWGPDRAWNRNGEFSVRSLMTSSKLVPQFVSVQLVYKSYNYGLW